MGILKNIMRKSQDQDFHLALLGYRNTPITGMEESPVQLLNSRVLRDKLPRATKLRRPKVVENVKLTLQRRKEVQKKYYDRGAKIRKGFRAGETIRMRKDGKWKKGIITGEHDTPRSYHVKTEDGGEYRRNSRFLRHTREPPPLILPEEVQITPASTEVRSGQMNNANEPPPPQVVTNDTEVAPQVQAPVTQRRSTRERKRPVRYTDYEM